MGIFIIYIGKIRPLFHFDYTNVKASLIIKIINFKGINKMAHLAMFGIFIWMQLFVKFLIYHTFIASLVKKSFFEMKILKLITWYKNMVQTMWNDMVQYTFNFHKDFKLFKFFPEYICVF